MTSTTTTTKQSKTWVIAAAAFMGFIGVVIWALSRPPVPADELATTTAPEPAPVAAPKPPTPPAEIQHAKVAPVDPAEEPAPEPQPSAAPAPVDLFAGEMPDFMAELHAKVLAKRHLNVNDQKQLYKWGQEHKDDARPQLLLAWDSRNRDWDGMAINVYGIAFRADPRATQDPNNLRDLLKLAANHEPGRVEFTEATDILRTHFGLNALPMIDEVLEDMNARGDITRATRLSQMRDILRGH